MSVSSRSSSRSSTSYRSRAPIEIVTEALPYAPEPPSPRYNLSRRSSFVRERRTVVPNVFDRIPIVEDEQYHQYRQLAKRPHSPVSISSNEATYGALIPVAANRELVRAHYNGAYIIDREPIPEKSKPVKKAKVVERKQTVMMRDTQGNWYKVKRTIKA